MNSTPQPPGGYGTNADKVRWRHTAYQFSDRTATGVRKRDRVVACLDTAEGLEVRHALAFGFDAGNIHVFNDGNGDTRSGAATLANLTRALDRDRLPRVHTHATSIARASDVIGRGAIDVLTLDFCGPAGNMQNYEIARASRALKVGGVVMVNQLAAREQWPLCSAADEWINVEQRPIASRLGQTERMRARDAERVQRAIISACAEDVNRDEYDTCARTPVAWRWGRYRSGRSPFVWCAALMFRCDGYWPKCNALMRPFFEIGECPPDVFNRLMARSRYPFLCVCERVRYQGHCGMGARGQA